MTEATHGAFETKPTLAQRAARFFGFRYHLGEDPEGVDAYQGWMVTETRMHFGFLDRVRLLVSGKLHIKLVQHTPEEVDDFRNRLDWRILPPGEPLR